MSVESVGRTKTLVSEGRLVILHKAGEVSHTGITVLARPGDPCSYNPNVQDNPKALGPETFYIDIQYTTPDSKKLFWAEVTRLLKAGSTKGNLTLLPDFGDN